MLMRVRRSIEPLSDQLLEIVASAALKGDVSAAAGLLSLYIDVLAQLQPAEAATKSAEAATKCCSAQCHLEPQAQNGP
ncbi:MAG: hypothetical protein V5B39_21440 [Accumulibacter sp.]|uniref:hypothetical protein n=1 Tax=Accumulibacter sp. TaxID=2053492 RepID=UPI002FC2F200